MCDSRPQSRAFFIPLGTKQAKIRPSWWTAEGVLACIRNGESAAAVCRRASDELGGRVKPTSLRNDISTWCETASVGPAFKQAIALYHHTGPGEYVVSRDWQPDFLAALHDCDGRIEAACEQACVGPELVYGSLDKRNRHLYSEEFAEKVRVLEGARISPIRERVLNEAASPNGDPKIALKVLETHLPDLHGQKSHLSVSAEVKVEHGLAREVVEASAARTRALMAGRQGVAVGALDAGDRDRPTIDVTPLRVHATAVGEEREG